MTGKTTALALFVSLTLLMMLRPCASVKASPQDTGAQAWPSLNTNTHKTKKSGRADFAAVQYLLRARGFYQGKVNGMFDSRTITAVKAFQRSRKLRVDGIVGPQTLSALVIKVQRGSKGDAVRAVQTLLRNMPELVEGEMMNLGLSVDGVFGARTEKALIAAQSDFNLTKKQLVEDGIMGSDTWRQMLRFASEQD